MPVGCCDSYESLLTDSLKESLSLPILDKGKPVVRLGRNAKDRQSTAAGLPKGCSITQVIVANQEGKRHNNIVRIPYGAGQVGAKRHVARNSVVHVLFRDSPQRIPPWRTP